MAKLRAAVIGAGHLGRYHAQKYARLPELELLAVVDTAPDRAQAVAAEVGSRACDDYRELLADLDLVSIAVPTQQHYDVASACLSAGVHVLVEKPITSTVEQARALVDLAHRDGLILQVGHSERFHPALQVVREELVKPLFIESHRLAPFGPRGTDVSVALDLMIHDIDILLTLIDSPLVQVQPVGIPVITGDLDIVNARLEFANGCVANVTASRVSVEPMRKMRFFQHRKYLSVDFIEHSVAVKDCETQARQGTPDLKLRERVERFEQPDMIFEEIRAFVDSVAHKRPVSVTGEQAVRALELALNIGEQLAERRPG